MNCPLCFAFDSHLVPTKLGSFFHCAHCDLIHRHPEERLSPWEEKARYETHNNDTTDPRYRNFVSPLVESIRQKLQPGCRGLDFGAGTGPVLTKMFEECLYPMELYDPYFWPDPAPLFSEYDFVCTSEVVEHFFYPAKEFSHFKKLLRPGGILGIMTLLHGPETNLATWYYLKDPTHVVFYSKNTFQWIARHFGFSPPEFLDKRVILLRRPMKEPLSLFPPNDSSLRNNSTYSLPRS
jgi:SAM-dependent methyltransferase